MPEYRVDDSTGRMVIVAEERASRPYQFDIERERTNGDDFSYHKDCPFCEGNESATPGELAAIRNPDTAADSPGWSVRTVPNLYPAVSRNAEEEFRNAKKSPDAFSRSIPGFGAHEVIVDTPRHLLSVGDMTEPEIDALFKMYARRLQSLRTEGCFAAAMIFKNVGQAAGASLPHAHSQLVAMPFVPESLRNEMERAKRHAEKKGTPCLWCDTVRSELRERDRIVEETERFVALCPFVSRFPAEIAVYPKKHEPFFEEQNLAELSECGRLIRRMILRLEKSTPWMRGRLAYNMVLHTGPLERRQDTLYHFHWAILPSLSRAAGFEWGTGLHINPISPESAAARLRNAQID